MHVLDLDMMDDLGDRARALFDVVTLRAYTAAILGRLNQRTPYGAHRGPVPMDLGQPVRLALNDTRDHVHLVMLDFAVSNDVILSDGPSAGSTNFAQSGQGAGIAQPYILFPGDALFGTATVAANSAVISVEVF